MRHLAIAATVAFLGSQLIGNTIVDNGLKAVVEVRAKTGAGTSAGTGFIIQPDGVVVTCYHVIQGASEVAIRLSTGEIYEDLRVVASDRKRDLALLKFAGFNLPVIPLGNSDGVAVGEDVFVIGHPSGLENSVTRGIVSAVRSIDGIRLIQTDSAASPGNSGGPVLNRSGESIGVVSFKMSGEGLNFAIPSSYVKGLLGMQSPMTLAEFNVAAKSTEAGLFGKSQRGLTGKWRSLDTNTIKVLRESGDYVHGEALSRDESQSFGSYDFRRGPDGTFAGRVKGPFNCEYWCLACFPARWVQNSCVMEHEIVLTKVASERIEGYVVAPKMPAQNDKAFGRFCKTCGSSVAKTKQPFVWVRVE